MAEVLKSDAVDGHSQIKAGYAVLSSVVGSHMTREFVERVVNPLVDTTSCNALAIEEFRRYFQDSACIERHFPSPILPPSWAWTAPFTHGDPTLLVYTSKQTLEPRLWSQCRPLDMIRLCPGDVVCGIVLVVGAELPVTVSTNVGGQLSVISPSDVAFNGKKKVYEMLNLVSGSGTEAVLKNPEDDFAEVSSSGVRETTNASTNNSLTTLPVLFPSQVIIQGSLFAVVLRPPSPATRAATAPKLASTITASAPASSTPRAQADGGGCRPWCSASELSTGRRGSCVAYVRREEESEISHKLREVEHIVTWCGEGVVESETESVVCFSADPSSLVVRTPGSNDDGVTGWTDEPHWCWSHHDVVTGVRGDDRPLEATELVTVLNGKHFRDLLMIAQRDESNEAVVSFGESLGQLGDSSATTDGTSHQGLDAFTSTCGPAISSQLSESRSGRWVTVASLPITGEAGFGASIHKFLQNDALASETGAFLGSMSSSSTLHVEPQRYLLVVDGHWSRVTPMMSGGCAGWKECIREIERRGARAHILCAMWTEQTVMQSILQKASAGVVLNGLKAVGVVGVSCLMRYSFLKALGNARGGDIRVIGLRKDTGCLSPNIWVGGHWEPYATASTAQQQQRESSKRIPGKSTDRHKQKHRALDVSATYELVGEALKFLETLKAEGGRLMFVSSSLSPQDLPLLRVADVGVCLLRAYPRMALRMDALVSFEEPHSTSFPSLAPMSHRSSPLSVGSEGRDEHDGSHSLVVNTVNVTVADVAVVGDESPLRIPFVNNCHETSHNGKGQREGSWEVVVDMCLLARRSQPPQPCCSVM